MRQKIIYSRVLYLSNWIFKIKKHAMVSTRACLNKDYKHNLYARLFFSAEPEAGRPTVHTCVQFLQDVGRHFADRREF